MKKQCLGRRPDRPLKVNKETLRRLSENEIQKVQGGGTHYYGTTQVCCATT